VIVEDIFTNLERFAAEEMVCVMDIYKNHDLEPLAQPPHTRCLHCKFLKQLRDLKAEYIRRGEPFPYAPEDSWKSWKSLKSWNVGT